MSVAIGTALRVENRPPSALKPDPRNARTHPKRQVNQIVASILEFGFVNPILVDENGVIIAGHGRLLRAAQYVRMSTDHQRYSTENQADAILKYADAHGLRIVRTYSDEGKSGLNVEGRLGLQALLRDTMSARRRTDRCLLQSPPSDS